MAKELKYRCFLEHEDGTVEPFTGYTPEQAKKVSERLSRTVSAYFQQHLDEYEKFINSETMVNKNELQKTGNA